MTVFCFFLCLLSDMQIELTIYFLFLFSKNNCRYVLFLYVNIFNFSQP